MITANSEITKLGLIPLLAVTIDLAFLGNNSDPLNPVKMWILGSGAIFCIVKILTIRYEKMKFARFSVKSNTLLLLFPISLIIVYGFMDQKLTGIIGSPSRNLGIFNYLSLFIVATYYSMIVDMTKTRLLFRTIFALTLFFNFYGTLQHFNADPISWNILYNKVTLTIGNSDFTSAILAIFSLVILVNALDSKSIYNRIFGIVTFFYTIIVIKWTGALQGLVLVILGITIIINYNLHKKNRSIFKVTSIISSIAGLISLLGMLNIGPLSSYLYKSSVVDRGYNWRAGWHMFIANPLRGVGIDRFGAYFLEYRDSKYPLLYGYQQSVNNAHNVFINFFATGGLILGVSYLILVGFVSLKAIKLWKMRSARDEYLILGIILGWILFLSQQIISVDVLSVSIWGWIFGATIVGLSETDDSEKRIIKDFRKSKKTYLINSIILVLFFNYLLLVNIMYQAQSQMYKFQNFNQPKNDIEIKKYLNFADRLFNSTFIQVEEKVLIAFQTTNLGQLELGKKYFNEIISKDPRRSDAMQFLATIHEHEKNLPMAVEYRIRAEKIDPYSAPNLIQLQKDYILMNNRKSADEIKIRLKTIAPESAITQESQSL